MKTRLKNPDGTWEDVELPPGSDIPIDGGDTGVSCWPPNLSIRESVYPKLAELLDIVDRERGNLSGEYIMLIRTRLVQTQRRLWTSPKNQGK